MSLLSRERRNGGVFAITLENMGHLYIFVSLLLLVPVLMIELFSYPANASHCVDSRLVCLSECANIQPGPPHYAWENCVESCERDNDSIAQQYQACVDKEFEEYDKTLDLQQSQRQPQPQGQPPTPKKTETKSLPKTLLPPPQSQQLKTQQSPSEIAVPEKILPSAPTTKKILEVGKDIKEGDTIITNKGEALVIKFLDGSYMQVGERSTLTLNTPRAEETLVELLKQGKFRFLIKKLLNREFKVRFLNLTASVRGTDFTMDVSPDAVGISVQEGVVEVSDTMSKKTIPVSAGTQILIHTGGELGEPVPSDSDELHQWFKQWAPEPSDIGSTGNIKFIIIGVLFVVALIAVAFFVNIIGGTRPR